MHTLLVLSLAFKNKKGTWYTFRSNGKSVTCLNNSQLFTVPFFLPCVIVILRILWKIFSIFTSWPFLTFIHVMKNKRCVGRNNYKIKNNVVLSITTEAFRKPTGAWYRIITITHQTPIPLSLQHAHSLYITWRCMYAWDNFCKNTRKKKEIWAKRMCANLTQSGKATPGHYFLEKR